MKPRADSIQEIMLKSHYFFPDLKYLMLMTKKGMEDKYRKSSKKYNSIS